MIMDLDLINYSQISFHSSYTLWLFGLTKFTSLFVDVHDSRDGDKPSLIKELQMTLHICTQLNTQLLGEIPINILTVTKVAVFVNDLNISWYWSS